MALRNILNSDPRWESGEIIHYNSGVSKPECKNTQPAKDINLISIGRIPLDDPRWKDNKIIAACTKNFYIIKLGADIKIIKKNDLIKFSNWCIIN